MSGLSGAQTAAALALLREIRQTRSEVAQLRQHHAACEIAHDSSMAALGARCNCFSDQRRFAGLAEFAQAFGPDALALAAGSYRLLLSVLLHPDPETPPLRIDYSTLDPAVRPYLVRPYLGMTVAGAHPFLCLVQSRPEQGVLHYVARGGPMDAKLWRTKLPEITAWLGGCWTIADSAATSVTLKRQPPLPATIPYSPHLQRAGALLLGIDVTTRQPVHLPFAELSSGTYIPGASGTGKTSAVHLLVRSLLANLALFDAVWLVDGKDGVAMARYAGRDPKVQVVYEDEEVWALIARLTATLRDRNAAQRAAGIENATGNFIALLIDELPSFVAKPPGEARKAHAEFLDNLARLAMRGRSAGLRMFFVSQSPVADQIPVTLRSNCLTTVAFRLPETTHATMLFGQLENLPADPRRLPRGQALVLEGLTGRLTHVQFPLAPLLPPRGVP